MTIAALVELTSQAYLWVQVKASRDELCFRNYEYCVFLVLNARWSAVAFEKFVKANSCARSLRRRRLHTKFHNCSVAGHGHHTTKSAAATKFGPLAR